MPIVWIGLAIGLGAFAWREWGPAAVKVTATLKGSGSSSYRLKQYGYFYLILPASAQNVSVGTVNGMGLSETSPGVYYATAPGANVLQVSWTDPTTNQLQTANVVVTIV